MVVSKIDEIVQLVSNKTSYDPNIVADVVKHTLTSLKQFFDNPTSAGVRLTYLGTFIGNANKVHYYIIKSLIPAIRAAETDEQRHELLDQLAKL